MSKRKGFYAVSYGPSKPNRIKLETDSDCTTFTTKQAKRLVEDLVWAIREVEAGKGKKQ